jgi:hypothetical protein
MTDSSLSSSEPVLVPDRPFGRVARSVLGYALAIALMIVTPIVVFVPAALLHCALRNGRRLAWATLALSLVLAGGYVAVVPAESPAALQMAWTYIAAVAVAIALPAMLVLPLVERGETFGRVLAFLLIGSAIGLALTEIAARQLLSFSPYAAQVQQARLSNAGVMEIYRANQAGPEMLQFAQKWSDYSLFVLPGSMLIVISLIFILSLMMLGRLPAWRNWVARRGDPAMADVYHFRNLALPDWMLFAFILGGLTPLATGMLQKAAANTLAVVAFLYILQGLAIFRFVLASVGAGIFGTMLAWMLLGFLTLAGGVGPLLLGVAGLFDPFFDFRHFKKRKDDSHESHSD